MTVGVDYFLRREPPEEREREEEEEEEERFGDDLYDELDFFGEELLRTLGVERGVERILGLDGVTRRMVGARRWVFGLECLIAPLGMVVRLILGCRG